MTGWAVVALGSVCQIINGGTPKSEVVKYWGGNNQWITPKDMGKLQSKFVEETERQITDAGLQNCSAKLSPPKSVILSSRAPIGHLAINLTPMATNQGCKTLIPSATLDFLYLYYFLSHSKQLLNDLGSGTTFKELSSSKLSEVPIPLPPLAIQKAIVAKLDAAFASIDTAIAAAEKNAENAKQLFQSYLSDVFEKGGEGWVEKNLDQIASNEDYRRIPITKNQREAGLFPYYGASGIVDYVADFIFDGDYLLISEDGANLLARTYPIAFSVSGKIWVNNHAHILRFESIVLQKYVEFYLNSIPLNRFVSGMAQPKLNQKMLNSIPIPVPPTKIQSELMHRFDQLSVHCATLSKVSKEKVNSLSALKQSLLQQAFSGQLVDA